MKQWEKKAHKWIHELCKESYINANKKRKKHVAYSVPNLAEELIHCLKNNNEEQAKFIFLAYN